MTHTKNSLVTLPVERIVNTIYVIRGKKVILDRDLAQLYQVKTKVLNQAIRRNIERFPEDFMFQLNQGEFDSLRSQIVTLDGRGKHRKYLPYAFTEQGVAMLSSVLKSDRAIQVNIAIMRTFTKLRELMASNGLLREKIESLEKKHKGHDQSITRIFRVLQHLLQEDSKPKREIGFRVNKK